MIDFRQHQSEVFSLFDAPTTTVNQVPVTQSVGRILATDVQAQLAVPPFSNSAMDGFAVLQADLDAGVRDFPVSADVPAGEAPIMVTPGHAVRIMTGAPVVEAQADQLTIIPVEATNIEPGPVALPQSITVQQISGKRHLRRLGESCQVGAVVATAGSRIDPGTIAALISTGVTNVSVFAPITVAIISSGDELSPANLATATQLGHIPDSNAPMLQALVHSVSPARATCYHVSDDIAAFSQQLTDLTPQSDLIVTTGGVSAGAFDVIKTALQETAEFKFQKVSMQPGKPQGFGRIHGTPILCLPGNPVSAFVSFHLFVKPLLLALSGTSQWRQQPIVSLPVSVALTASPHRDLFVPCRIDWATQTATVPIPHGKGSHFVSSLAGINGIIYLSASQGSVESGDNLPVYLL